jgi:G3E family GTPase
MNKLRLILVGGFLGAGKTTMLWEAADRIIKKGKRVGLVTNDQAPELVDTALLLHKNIKVAEVSGSCFCCNFNGLLDSIGHIREEANADVIIAEPVGSCTDLSATILQPLKARLNNNLLLSPLTVMADPVQLTDILQGGTAGLHPGAAYIYIKQLEESDIILISKSDLLSSGEMDILKEKVRERFPFPEVRSASVTTGEGIDEWLEEVLKRTNAGLRIVDVDYDLYAKGEAVLGWLNCTIELSSVSADWDHFAQGLMQKLNDRFKEMKAPVGHVKILIENGENYITGNLTGSSDKVNFRGSAGKGDRAKLILNARVEMDPDSLEKIIRDVLEVHLNGKIKARYLGFRCLSPGRPNPTFRFDHIVPVEKT